MNIHLPLFWMFTGHSQIGSTSNPPNGGTNPKRPPPGCWPSASVSTASPRRGAGAGLRFFWAAWSEGFGFCFWASFFCRLERSCFSLFRFFPFDFWFHFFVAWSEGSIFPFFSFLSFRFCFGRLERRFCFLFFPLERRFHFLFCFSGFCLFGRLERRFRFFRFIPFDFWFLLFLPPGAKVSFFVLLVSVLWIFGFIFFAAWSEGFGFCFFGFLFFCRWNDGFFCFLLFFAWVADLSE